jgi:hypothetical protein
LAYLLFARTRALQEYRHGLPPNQLSIVGRPSPNGGAAKISLRWLHQAYPIGLEEGREPPRTATVLFVMREIVMRKFANKNDLWDWGVILLLVAGGTLILWASVWVVHSRGGAPRAEPTHVQALAAAALRPISRDGS